MTKTEFLNIVKKNIENMNINPYGLGQGEYYNIEKVNELKVHTETINGLEYMVVNVLYFNYADNLSDRRYKKCFKKGINHTFADSINRLSTISI